MSQQQPADPTFFPFYFQMVARTEPPLIFHRWAMLTSLGATLGRQFWLPFGDGRIFPNIYTMLMGNPGTRKSTAILRAKKVVSAAGYDKFAHEKTSKEKFLMDLADMPDVPDWQQKSFDTKKANSPLTGFAELMAKHGAASSTTAADHEAKEVFIVADEFNEFVGSGNLEFLSMLGVLWDWDREEAPYKYRTKTSKSIEIWQPTVSICSGNTHASFQLAFPPATIGQGFLSRLLLIYGDRARMRLAFPEAPSPHLVKLIVERIQQIRKDVNGPAVVDDDARKALTHIYGTWRELDDNRFQYYSSRRHTHLLKCCLLMAAARCSTTITLYDVVYANSVLSYAEALMPKAMGEFGKSRDSEAGTKLMQLLYNSRLPVPPPRIIDALSHDLDKAADIQALLAKFAAAGRIQYIKDKGWAPCAKRIDTGSSYVNYRMVAEMPYELGGKGDADTGTRLGNA